MISPMNPHVHLQLIRIDTDDLERSLGISRVEELTAPPIRTLSTELVYPELFPVCCALCTVMKTTEVRAKES
ncbi:hypothetical protein [Saccharopolyspora spinosa]|uniref:Uncharacterized protein n=1 Tax=Saccharopolyspora spinosa TaxID=60894 RepID=A0A2N3XXX0_SACSN|nr:hypothetical protein [Saccharopolyspora spinosa]PKW15543.1 hypothetical protein A8926_3271 [Saccharopolyspora spinosa]